MARRQRRRNPGPGQASASEVSQNIPAKNMEQLPDDVLIMVLQYVDLPDLFTCRLVSKRLGALAVTPAVWRGRRLLRPQCARWICPVLRTAPSLSRLDLVIPAGEPGCCQLMLASTRCAVTALNMLVYELGATQAALVIRRQEALGRLRVLTVVLLGVGAAETSMLLATIASMPDLTWLSVTGTSASKPNLDSHFSSVSTAALRCFRFQLWPESASFCNFIIAAHANALEEVHLVCPDRGTSFATLTSMAPLLAGLPVLRELCCPMLPGLEAMADCKSLRELTLFVRPEDRPGAGGAATLLSRANQLRAVTLEYIPSASHPADVGVSLVLALAASGLSTVESLTILNGWAAMPQVQPLLTALPFLRSLRHLELSAPQDALLLGITPASAPALQTLALRYSKCAYGVFMHPCAHSWLHYDEVNTLLSVNPELQLLVARGSGLYCKDRMCATCQRGCHSKLRDCNLQLIKEKMLVPRNIPQ
ncbi:uncharacterized protein LOC113206817 [Frankliniella occidentalis]|uniref:Uncharacterized protein LOC113206817 n=1 Tax=Frankliniella occidentalis TaxID=133901 RepID=A0A6J1SCE4_FRAOC|nr:uncharacterized protein LOC113206817 [Frankliniella occidentalis]